MQDMDALKKQVEESSKKQAELSKQNVELSKKQAELSKQNAELSKQNAELKRQVEELQKGNVAIKQVEDLKKQVANLSNGNASLIKENANSKQEIARLSKENANSKAEIARLSKENSSKIEELKRQLVETQKVNASKIATLENKSIKFGDILENTATGFHNSIFRGKDITKYYNDGSLFTRISSGKFDDLFVGDYILKNGITWRIAGFDIFLNKGDKNPITKHHACIVPDTKLATGRMNRTITTAGGYVGSEMYKTTLNKILSDYITPVFGNHVITYRTVLTTGISSTQSNRRGVNGGGSNDWCWFDRKLDLMNENQLLGSIVWSSTGLETGADNTQFPLFKLAPDFIYNEKRSYNDKHFYWLRSITDTSSFVTMSTGGIHYGTSSPTEYGGIRPYFYID
jgi:cell division protein FtsB